ncbi:MAG: type I-B CRISPR-associated endonuclease Cas1b [Candidatus Aenigmatarchaeota archaeon]
MRNVYIFSIGKLYRKKNNIYFKPKDKEEKYFPIENLKNIFVMNKVSFSYQAIKMLMDRGIFVHFYYFNEKKGIFYKLGTLYPKDKNPAGIVHLKQSLYHTDINKRVEIALEIVDATKFNCIKVLEKFDEAKEIANYLRSFSVFSEFEKHKCNVQNLMDLIRGIEGNVWIKFFEGIDKILKYYKLEKRTKRPPKNEANAIVSFCNSLLYSVILSEIYRTHLDPTISFLHEPRERRFSLALDMAEPFKPIITYRILIYLINKGIINSNHFIRGLEGILLNEYGRRIVVEEFERRINETIKIKGKGKFKMLTFIRKQAYNLEKALLEDTKFEAFRLRY